MKFSFVFLIALLTTTNGFVHQRIGRTDTALNAIGWNVGKVDSPRVAKKDVVITDLKQPLDKMGKKYKAADGSIILGPSQMLSASVLAMAPFILAVNPPGE